MIRAWGAVPRSERPRVDWLCVAAWAASVVFCLVFWAGLVWMLTWAIS